MLINPNDSTPYHTGPLIKLDTVGHWLLKLLSSTHHLPFSTHHSRCFFSTFLQNYLSLNVGIAQNTVLSLFLPLFYILAQDHLICYCDFNYYLYTKDSQKYITSPTVAILHTYEYPSANVLDIARHKLNLPIISLKPTPPSSVSSLNNWHNDPPNCPHQKPGHLIIINNLYPYLISVQVLTCFLTPQTWL